MSTKTQTTTTHYHIQKKRRAEFIEEWRKYRQSVIREEDVTLVAHRARPAHRRLHGLGRRPSDALPRRAGARGRSGHRHDDPPPLVGRDPLHGRGHRVDRGRRRPLRLEAVGRDPHPRVELASPRQRRRRGRALHELLVGAHALDARHEPDRGPRATSRSPSLPPRPAFSRRHRPATIPTRAACAALALETKKRRSGRIHTPYDEQEILATPRGTRTKFLNDRAIGNEASGLTQVMIQFAPGQDAVAAPASGRSVALRRRGPRPQLPRHRARQGRAPPLEEGRPHRRRPLPLAPALQRRPGQPVPPGARPHVRLDPRDDARARWTRWCSSRRPRTRCSRCRSSRRSSWPDDRRPEASDGSPALRAAAGRAVDARPARRAPRPRLGRDHRPARGEGAAARAGAARAAARPQALDARRGCRTASSCSPARRAPARPRWRAASRRWRRSRSRGRAPPRSSRSTRTRFRATCSARASAT